jgi:hypothetical protein
MQTEVGCVGGGNEVPAYMHRYCACIFSAASASASAALGLGLGHGTSPHSLTHSLAAYI